MPNLDDLARTYAGALAKSTKPIPFDQLVRLLTLRDLLAVALQRTAGPVSASALTAVQASDEVFRGILVDITRHPDLKMLFQLRALRRPPRAAWWWHPDAEAGSSWMVLGCNLAAAAGIAVMTAVASATISRFLVGERDALTILAVSLQMAGPIVASTSFTRSAQDVLSTLKHRVPSSTSRAIYRLTLSAIALAVVLLSAAQLRSMAMHYNGLGLDRFTHQDLAGAKGYFEKAVALAPDEPYPHYNLANTLEELASYDAALDEYRIALTLASRTPSNSRHDPDKKLDPNRVLNNLARLMMAVRGDYATAVHLLDRALKSPISDTSEEVSLYKNRGWARFGLGAYEPARLDLERAIELDHNAPAAHCLLAQLLEARHQDATEEWVRCVPVAGAAANETWGAEARWFAVAQDKIWSTQ